MAQNRLANVVITFKKDLDETDRLVLAAEQWANFRFPSTVARFTSRHKELIIRFAFLQGFLAWEEFLDESFTLYLLGEKAPRGRRPLREYSPRRRKDAIRLITGADRKYADWTRTDNLRKRSKTFFRRHDPFDTPLRANNTYLQDMAIIRNAIAHRSQYSREEFQKLVRRFFRTYPPGLTIGQFLRRVVPNSSPPQTFLAYYFDSVATTADLIVPH
jgi:hypothetical protein